MLELWLVEPPTQSIQGVCILLGVFSIGGLPESERFFGQFFWHSELITIDDGVTLEDFFYIGKAIDWYFDALKSRCRS